MKKWEWELKKGNIWRAKEILRGHIAQIYQPDEYVAYGKLLYDLKDYYEAGKYLFAGGVEIDGKYKDAIYVFLERNNSLHLNEFMSKFPYRFSNAPYDSLPLSVIQYIESRFQLKEVEHQREKNKMGNSYEISKNTLFQKVQTKFYELILIVVIIFFIASVSIGAFTILHRIGTYVFGKDDNEHCVDICKTVSVESLQECIEKEHALIKRLDPSIQKIDHSKSY